MGLSLGMMELLVILGLVAVVIGVVVVVVILFGRKREE